LSSELARPEFHLETKPELDAPVTELADGARHIGISVLVDANGIPVGESEEFRDSVRVEEVIDVYLSAHSPRLLQYSDPSGSCIRLQ
jgi:hypothetical protein